MVLTWVLLTQSGTQRSLLTKKGIGMSVLTHLIIEKSILTEWATDSSLLTQQGTNSVQLTGVQWYTKVLSVVHWHSKALTGVYKIRHTPNIQISTVFIYTRSSGCSTPLLLVPAQGWGGLQALFRAFGPHFITKELYFESEFPFLGGVCFIKLFDWRPPYICFWFFGTLGGLFWVWFLVFENL